MELEIGIDLMGGGGNMVKCDILPNDRLKGGANYASDGFISKGWAYGR